MDITLIRNATLLVDTGGRRVIVDPCLDRPARGRRSRTRRRARAFFAFRSGGEVVRYAGGRRDEGKVDRRRRSCRGAECAIRHDMDGELHTRHYRHGIESAICPLWAGKLHFRFAAATATRSPRRHRRGRESRPPNERRAR
jgi:hypothetical protein